MGYIQYLQRSIDYIENNIREPLSIDDCANAAGFSRYHFYRLFGTYTGISVMEYVRKRRLAHAMHDVSMGKRVLDIALDFNYGSERAFRRAFCQEFGDNPSKFRGIHYSVPPGINLLNQSLFNKPGGFKMDSIYSDVRFVDLPEMLVASGTAISRSPEDDVIAFMNRWAENNNISPEARKFGFDVPVTEEQQKKGLRGYEYWISVDPGMSASSGVKLKNIKGCRYAVLRITEPFSDPFELIPNGWRKLVDWINSNGFKNSICDDRYWLEEIISENNATYMDLFFPIS
jgi:AraC family transcriptional regulator